MNQSNCVISAVGKNSLHRMWLEGECDFDLHLIVYDDSLELYHGDTPYICHIKGYKLKVIYQYLESHSELKEQYEYFFFPDDDIEMNAATINSIFKAMQNYKLKIAQPALYLSYYTWEHTLKDRYCKLRYTNFIEMMVPCFSREALKKVLFTFNENETGWGTEAHWPLLIDASSQDMAIIDEVSVKHTRPIQSGQQIHQRELAAYLEKYNISIKVCLYAVVPMNDCFCCDRHMFQLLKKMLLHWISVEPCKGSSVGENGHFGYAHLLFLMAGITQSQKFADAAYDLLGRAQDELGHIKDNMTFRCGLTGCCWLIEYLALEGFIDNDLQDILEEPDRYIHNYLQQNAEILSLEELEGIGKYYLIRLRNRPTDANRVDCQQVITLIRNKIDELLILKDNPRLLMKVLILLKECGVDVSGQICLLEKMLDCLEETWVEKTYLRFLFYLLKHDEYTRMRVRETAKNIVYQILTQEDALMIAEILYYTENNFRK